MPRTCAEWLAESMTIPRTSLVLSTIGLLAAIAGPVILFTAVFDRAMAEAAGNDTAASTALHRIALGLSAGVAPAGLLAALAMLSVRGRARGVVVALVVLGSAACALTAIGWAAGFAEADAGGPSSLLAEFTLPAAGIAVVLLAAAIALSVGSLLPLGRVARVVLGVLAGAIAAPLMLAIALLGYQLMVILLLALTLTLVVVRARQAPPAPATGPAGIAGTGQAGAAGTDQTGIRAAAITSLAITVSALGGGLIAGIALNGTDAATRAMGLMMAAGNLAAVPLIVAVTLWLGRGRGVAFLAAAIAMLGIAASCVYFAVSDSADPFAVTALQVIAASVGLWAAAMIWVRLPFRAGSRVVIAVLVGAGSALIYFMLAIATAGGLLLVASGYLAFRGIRRQRQPDPAAL